MYTFRKYLHEVDLSFKTIAIMKAKRSELYASFFLISIDETTSHMSSCCRKNLKGIKDKVCGLQPITSIRIPSSETYSAEIVQCGLEITLNLFQL